MRELLEIACGEDAIFARFPQRFAVLVDINAGDERTPVGEMPRHLDDSGNPAAIAGNEQHQFRRRAGGLIQGNRPEPPVIRRGLRRMDGGAGGDCQDGEDHRAEIADFHHRD